MEKKYEFGFGQKYFANDGDSHEGNFSNVIGQWHVVVKRTGSSIAGFISLKPASNFLDVSKIAAKIEFDSSSVNQIVVATRIPGQSCFHFAAVLDVFFNRIYKFDVIVDIDYSEVEIKGNLKSSVDHLKEMLDTGKLADITITTGGNETIKAHNFILSRSSVIDAMFNEYDTKEAREKVIKIEDIEYEVLVEMIRFMYTDQVPKIKEMACALLVAANTYDLPGLAYECCNYLIKNVSTENFVDVWVIAEKLDLPQLKASTIDFVIKNRKVVMSSDAWKQLKGDNWKLAMEVMEVCFVADS